MNITTPTPQAWPSIQPRPQPAATVICSETAAIDTAYARFLLAVMKARPHRLQALNSPDDLAGRVIDVADQIAACKTWLKVLVEDTAEHVALAKRPDDIVEAAMSDMAGDVIGQLEQAIERNAA